MAGMLNEEDLYHYWRMRESMSRDDPRHAMYGPLEHRQFVQETVRDNPWMSLPMAAAIPAYSAGKALGFFPKARSPASLDEIWAGYHGLTEGMLGHLVPSAQAQQQSQQPTVPPRQQRRGMIDGTMRPNPRTRTRHGGGGVRG